MEKVKLLIICCWFLFLAGMLFVVNLSQSLSNYFTENQFLILSFYIYSPLFIITILALIKAMIRIKFGFRTEQNNKHDYRED